MRENRNFSRYIMYNDSLARNERTAYIIWCTLYTEKKRLFRVVKACFTNSIIIYYEL